MLKRIMDRLFFTCEHTSYLVERDKVDRLPLLQRFRYWVHLRYCTTCMKFKKQSDRLDDILALMFHKNHGRKKLEKMDEVSKETMRKRLEEKINR
ncbi:hypothetical protein [Allomuricauda sp. F6463D]|uniref:hypothetical protein n=1 Tax=Allomuricauda sp. F6463D TaxID=2926409 RepID=UPI001FF6DCE0|nr:hypothetical protein [Muricauda sp. F6463D]MCK0160024.1 hypothetical protein [Muricauda sp. F6463D]